MSQAGVADARTAQAQGWIRRANHTGNHFEVGEKTELYVNYSR